MRNFARINNYWNRIEAWNDWTKLANEVSAAGYGNLVEKHKPSDNAGWRKIDKAIDALRADFDSAKTVKVEDAA